jgi:hypothetical protein
MEATNSRQIEVTTLINFLSVRGNHWLPTPRARRCLTAARRRGARFEFAWRAIHETVDGLYYTRSLFTTALEYILVSNLLRKQCLSGLGTCIHIDRLSNWHVCWFSPEPLHTTSWRDAFITSKSEFPSEILIGSFLSGCFDHSASSLALVQQCNKPGRRQASCPCMREPSLSRRQQPVGW